MESPRSSDLTHRQGSTASGPVEAGEPARSDLFTKRALVVISHLIERAALADAPGEPMIVCALFQRMPYFDRERAVYDALADRADVTVVGLVEDVHPALPAGITPVLLRLDEELAQQWMVVVLTPTFGAALVATDLEEIDEYAVTLETGRMFRGRWSTRRDEAYAEVERLMSALGSRLPSSARGTMEAVLRRVTEEPQHALEVRAEASMGHLVAQLERAQRDIASLRERSSDRHGEHDPQSGLYTERFLRRWTGSSASGTLPLGLILIEVPALTGLAERYGRRASANAATGIGEVLRRESRRIDRAVRLTEDAFLLAQPTVTEHHLLQVSGRLTSGLADLERTYPFLPLSGKSALLVSRERPLPLTALRAAAAQLRGRSESVTVLAG